MANSIYFFQDVTFEDDLKFEVEIFKFLNYNDDETKAFIRLIKNCEGMHSDCRLDVLKAEYIQEQVLSMKFDLYW